MKKQPFSLGVIASTLLAVCAFALVLAIFSRASGGIYNQLNIYDALNGNSQSNSENVDVIDKEDVLQLNGLNNGTNQFMINEFKNTYRVKA